MCNKVIKNLKIILALILSIPILNLSSSTFYLSPLILHLSLIPVKSLAYEYSELPGIKGYTPPKGWPWREPYTAEQLLYFREANRYNSSHIQIAVGAFLNEREHISQNIAQFTERFLYDRGNGWLDYGDVLDYYEGNVKEGDTKNKGLFFWAYPPEIKGRQVLMWDYLDTPVLRKDADRWLYLPTLRRIRRLSGADRSDSLDGGEWTYDDLQGREVFEQECRIIGEDILYPDDFRLENKVMPEVLKAEPIIKPIPCYVIEAKSKLPDYYLSKRLVWMNKNKSDRIPTHTHLREEQYDREGFLWKIFSDPFLFHPPFPQWKEYEVEPYVAPKVKKHYEIILNVWDIKINHQDNRYLYEFPLAQEQIETYAPVKLYDPEVMTAEKPFIPLSKMPRIKIKSPDQMTPKPKLFYGKFPEYRKIKEDVLKRDYIQKAIEEEKKAQGE